MINYHFQMSCHSFNGLFLVVDPAQPRGEEILVQSSALDERAHAEPITAVSWLPPKIGERRSAPHRIVTMATDGRVLVWALPKERNELRLLQRHLVTAGSIPRAVRQSKGSTAMQVGLTALSFSVENPDQFVVGTETGLMLRCSLRTEETTSAGDGVLPPPRLTGAGGEFDLGETSPVSFGFSSHSGPVYSVSCSPHHRNIFASAGTDGTLRISSMLRTSPVLVLEPGEGELYGIQWSPARPLILATAGGNGALRLYDLAASRHAPTETLTLDPGGGVDPVYSLAFSRARPHFLAAGGASGRVRVWNLGRSRGIARQGELDLLSSLIED